MTSHRWGPGMTVQGGVFAIGGRGRFTAAALLGAAVAAAAAGCSGSGAAERGEAVSLAVTPAAGAGKVRPDAALDVRAKGGTLEDVTVATKGEAVEGRLSGDRTGWSSRWSLQPGTAYTLTATALGNDGRTQTVTRQFRTAQAKRTLATTVTAPNAKEVVGVGMPIILQFERPVADRAAVERALEVRASKPAEGAWHWFDAQSVVFRTKQHWPAHTQVSFRAHLAGVRMAKGVYGGKNYRTDFEIGDEHIMKASENAHVMTVRKNGKKVRTMRISMGKGGLTKYTTTNGNHLTMDKASPVIMDSTTVGCGKGCPDYYRQTVYSAVRISDSGEYVHSAPWSVGSQGNSNVSHGCVNASPSDARWFYNFAYRGDPFKVTGSSRELDPQNGWGYWQLGWADWLKGSALKRAQQVGPQAARQGIAAAP
ncbi:Ig-like domain-containing protein [Spirillospora sp. CA-294931]|uniref:L,D-transpeptidase n=1 Tax=Spirillospora sp. CA-294931 TaxID=3240042 RepID=UPI003D8B4833